MTPWAYSTFLEAIENGQVEKVSFSADGKQALSIDQDGNRHETLILREQTTDLIKILTKKNVVFAAIGQAFKRCCGYAMIATLISLVFYAADRRLQRRLSRSRSRSYADLAARQCRLV